MALQGLLNSTALTPPPAAAPLPVAGSPAVAPPAAPTPGLGPPPAVASDPTPNVSEGEQSQYDDLVKQAYNVAYDDVPKFLEAIGGQGDAPTGLGTFTGQLFSFLVDSGSRQGIEFDNAIVLAAGEEFMGDAANFSENAGMHEFTDKEMETAVYIAADVYRGLQQDGGNIDPNAAAANMETLAAAEANGTLEEVLPGVTENVGAADQQGEALAAVGGGAQLPPTEPAPPLSPPPPSPLRGLVG
jgi:hypothetical protein